ncbi:hypothetical protein F6R98_09100 [Candidatus Methylospira mobilis]|uniref:Defence against restriction A N-terminal domain-containing protein n=1 Tax=Candidatus Methylospira mobilis TaxID=1808979 RepID=A0A5Q0BG23_9GAMM|nr:hypothetical protein [Candidatus Methylospira mobilis]QFY42760.1 hypothetical protein F6R98_09100 [Candidatus Methylospira mobilis]
MSIQHLFSFADLSVKDKAAKAAMKYFSRAGANVAQQDVDGKIKRTSGINYREMTFTFDDSQTVVMRINATGDVFQVLINGAVTPITNQSDQVAAIAEIVQKLNAGRMTFQQKLAKAQVAIPPGIKTVAPRMLEVLTQKRYGLKAAIQAVVEEIAIVTGSNTQAASE